MPSALIDDLTPNRIPRWAILWVLRATFAVAAIALTAASAGVPLFFNAVYEEFKNQTAATTELTTNVALLTKSNNDNVDRLEDLTGIVTRLVEEDVTNLRLEVSNMKAAGMLPGAVVKFDKIENTLADISEKLATVAPADVRREVREAEARLTGRMQRLEGQIDTIGRGGREPVASADEPDPNQ